MTPNTEALPPLPKEFGRVLAHTAAYSTGGYCAEVQVEHMGHLHGRVFTDAQMKDYARAALAQRQQAPTTAWLVEWRFNGVQWLYLWPSAPGGFSFTSDASKALRFARREDAEAALQWARDTDAARRPIGSLTRHGLALGEMLVTEHDWPDLTAAPSAQPRLTVRVQSFPESNGKRNWTALLVRVDPWGGLIGNCGGITIDRGEFWNRVAYEAERARLLIGERDTEPDVLDYGDDITTPDQWAGEVRGGRPVRERTAAPSAQAEPVAWQWRRLLGNPDVIEPFWTEWEFCSESQYQYALATPDHEARALCEAALPATQAARAEPKPCGQCHKADSWGIPLSKTCVYDCKFEPLNAAPPTEQAEPQVPLERLALVTALRGLLASLSRAPTEFELRAAAHEFTVMADRAAAAARAGGDDA